MMLERKPLHFLMCIIMRSFISDNEMQSTPPRLYENMVEILSIKANAFVSVFLKYSMKTVLLSFLFSHCPLILAVKTLG